MAYDSSTTAPTAWTTPDELTADQSARYGDYVKACDGVSVRAAANAQGDSRAREALKATGGDKAAALRIMLGGVA